MIVLPSRHPFDSYPFRGKKGFIPLICSIRFLLLSGVLGVKVAKCGSVMLSETVISIKKV